MSQMAKNLDHLKHHVQYPGNRAAITAACSNMSDVPKEDRDWFMKSLPDGTYNGPDDVMRALLKKV